jgi:hypothetical protein
MHPNVTPSTNLLDRILGAFAAEPSLCGRGRLELL